MVQISGAPVGVTGALTRAAVAGPAAAAPPQAAAHPPGVVTPPAVATRPDRATPPDLVTPLESSHPDMTPAAPSRPTTPVTGARASAPGDAWYRSTAGGTVGKGPVRGYPPVPGQPPPMYPPGQFAPWNRGLAPARQSGPHAGPPDRRSHPGRQ